MTSYTTLPSPLGELLAIFEGTSLTGLYFSGHRRGPDIDASWQLDPDVGVQLSRQLDEYFGGRRHAFDLTLELAGTAFQRSVWERLRDIGYGQTTTYQALAEQLGRPRAVRAVAGAVARNPISIIVPCHRVIGTGGRLTGYAGGLERKSRLLALEGSASADVG